MLVTVIVIAALLSGSAVLVSLQLSSSRSAGVTTSKLTALYCAEAGLSEARSVVAQNYAWWGTALTASDSGDFSEPAWLATAIGDHDLDGDSVTDFSVYLFDNDDELPTSNRAADSDLEVWIVSQCLKYPETPQVVRELVLYNGVTKCYPWQLGGCAGDGNTN